MSIDLGVGRIAGALGGTEAWFLGLWPHRGRSRYLLAYCGKPSETAAVGFGYEDRLQGFAFGDLPFEDFEGPFYMQLAAVEDQSELDRELVVAMHLRDGLGSPADRREAADQMRAIARRHLITPGGYAGEVDFLVVDVAADPPSFADNDLAELWNQPSVEPPWDLTLGQMVWDLHLAFAEAANTAPSIYAVSPETVEFIRSLAGHREEELALESILGAASRAMPQVLVEHAKRVAREVLQQYPGSSDQAADDFVTAWLEWQPGSGVAPPYET